MENALNVSGYVFRGLSIILFAVCAILTVHLIVHRFDMGSYGPPAIALGCLLFGLLSVYLSRLSFRSVAKYKNEE